MENNFQRVQQWLVCLALVKFDIDEGQLVETIVPQQSLNSDQQKILSLISFPDSNSFPTNEGTLQYIFRMKREKKCSERYSYGFSYFMQKKDPKIARGYLQKSFVIVTNLPFLNFFDEIVQMLGEQVFQKPEQTQQILNVKLDKMNQKSHSKFLLLLLVFVQFPPKTDFQGALEYISQWDSPLPASKLSCLLFSHQLELEIPSHFEIKQVNQSPQKPKTGSNGSDKTVITDDEKNLQKIKEIPIEKEEIKEEKEEKQEQQSPSSSNAPPSKTALSNVLSLSNNLEQGAFQEINVLQTVRFSRMHVIWKIWQLVVTNQSFMLVSDSPTQCSEAILGFISLISPLDFIGDFRPYFTLYDPEYKVLQQECEKRLLRNIIIGVTNPLFMKVSKIPSKKKEYEIEKQEKIQKSSGGSGSGSQINQQIFQGVIY